MAQIPPQLPNQLQQKRQADQKTQQAFDNVANPVNLILQWIYSLFSFASGVLTINWPVTVSKLTVTKSITVAGSSISTTVGNLLVTGTLTVDGATTLSSTLGVMGTLTGAGASFTTLSTSGLATLNSLGVTNNATVGGTLGVTGNVTNSANTYSATYSGGNNATSFTPDSSALFELKSSSPTQNFAIFGLNSGSHSPPVNAATIGSSIVTWNHSGGSAESNWVNAFTSPGGHTFDSWNGTTYSNLAKIDSSGNLTTQGTITSTGNISTTLATATLYGASITGGNSGNVYTALGSGVFELYKNSTNSQNWAYFLIPNNGSNPSAAMSSFPGSAISSNHSNANNESNWVNGASTPGGHYFDSWNGTTYTNLASINNSGKFVAGNGTASTSAVLNGSAPGIKHCLGYYYYNGSYGTGNTVVSLLVAGIGLSSTSWVTVMPFAGSVVAISFDAENLTTTGAITGYIYKNGSALCNTNALTGTVGTLYTSNITFAKATYTFAAGDTLDFRIKSFNSQTTLQAVMWIWVEMDG